MVRQNFLWHAIRAANRRCHCLATSVFEHLLHSSKSQTALQFFICMIQKFWNPVKQWCSEHAYYWFSSNFHPCPDMISFFFMIITSWLFDLPGQRPHGRSSTTRRGARHHLEVVIIVNGVFLMKIVVIINGVFLMKVVVTINDVFSINKLLQELDDIFELSAPRHQWSSRTCCRELSSAWTARSLAPEQKQRSRWKILREVLKKMKTYFTWKLTPEQEQWSRWNILEYSEQA